ncbi:conserved protein of unknown function [Petrocella atlantisensis]|uniref:Pilus assembly protein n=1 Tax=Petrocella atlantisensis TaxID=2173034 RepID=A0A3P7SA47_9FIRM|nr:hypothetical protein [Petrocella atlantisensis]PKM54286.1 MAG: hypothetical protein CVV00_08850 [Firmicutes bacterium HGW-Firmicutes-5]VDN48759.1 conserved protein of unknown function [Petrocella atlantisensis]
MKRGSITIEACIVVPIVLLVLGVLVMTSLYLHDIIILRSVNTLRGDQQVITGEAYEEEEDWILFAIKGNHKSQHTSKMWHDRYVNRIQENEKTSLLGITYELDDERSFKAIRPKAYVRMLDFMDDATDKIGYTKALKDQVDQQVTNFIDTLTN